MWLDVSPKRQHQVAYHASHAALNELRVERVHPEVQHLVSCAQSGRQGMLAELRMQAMRGGGGGGGGGRRGHAQRRPTLRATATLWSVPRKALRTACIMRGMGGMRCSSLAGASKHSSAASSSCASRESAMHRISSVPHMA